MIKKHPTINQLFKIQICAIQSLRSLFSTQSPAHLLTNIDAKTLEVEIIYAYFIT